jgi:hypothetical protein
MGQTPSTSRVLVQQQLPREHQNVTFRITLWATLPHATELVWVRWKGYLWSRRCDRGRRESEANPCKHLDCPISSKELHRQEAPPLEIWSGDHVYLRVSPIKDVCLFGIKGQLAPRYIGLYPIIDKYGPLSYQVELPSKLSGVHNVFHVSQLKRCLKHPTDVVVEDTIPLEPDLTYKAYLTKILDQQDRVTRNKTTRFYKVQWNDHSEDEATWEHENFLWSNYPDFLPSR